jgi:mannose-6-phosphate isomerase-like protein (cupin superfamily)
MNFLLINKGDFIQNIRADGLHLTTQIVKPVLPEKLNDKMFVHVLRDDKKVSQILIWTAVNYPDEVYEDVEESFIILQGKCKCYIEDETVELGPGGFLKYQYTNIMM